VAVAILPASASSELSILMDPLIDQKLWL